MINERKKRAIEQINNFNNKILNWQNLTNIDDFNEGIATFLLDINKFSLKTLNSFNDEDSPNLSSYAEGIQRFLQNIQSSTQDYLNTNKTQRISSIWSRKNNMRDNLTQSLVNGLQVQADAYATYFAKESQENKASKNEDFSMSFASNKNFISIPAFNDTYTKWNFFLPMEQTKDNFIYWLKNSFFVKLIFGLSVFSILGWGFLLILPKFESAPDVPYFLIDRVYNEAVVRGNDLNAINANIEAINQNYANEKLPINFKIKGKEIYVTLNKLDDDQCHKAISYREAVAPDTEGRTIINNVEILDKATTPNPYISGFYHPAKKVCEVKKENDVVLIFNIDKIYNINNNTEKLPSSFYFNKMKGIVDNFEYIRTYNNTSSARYFANSYYGAKAQNYLNYLKNSPEYPEFLKYVKEKTKEEQFFNWVKENKK